MTDFANPDPDEDLPEVELNRLFEEGTPVDVHFGRASRSVTYVNGQFYSPTGGNTGGGQTVTVPVTVSVPVRVDTQISEAKLSA